MSNILGYYNNEKTKVNDSTDENINMPVVFVRNANQQNQFLLMDTPNDLFYNPSTKTLHADNFNGAHSNLVEGEAIKLTHDSTNHTTMIDVNFDKNTLVTTSISSTDIILVQDSLDFLKTITGANLRESLKPTAGSNLSYGAGANVNTLNLDNTITDLTKLTVGTSPASDSNVGLETYGKLIASRIDSTGIQDLVYLNNAGGTGAESGIVFRTNAYNLVTRFDETNYKIGSSNAIFDGVLTEWMRVNATELKVSGDCNLTSTHQYKIDDTAIPNSILADNGLGLSSGVLKIDISSCVGKSTIASTDLFILQIADGTSKKITGAELLTATGGTDTTYTFTANNLQTVGTNINLNPVLTSMTSVNGQIFFDTKQLAVGEVNNTYTYIASGYSDTQGFLTCGSSSDGSRSSNGNIYNGWKFLYITSNGFLEIHRNNGSTTSVPALSIDRALGDVTLGRLNGGLNNLAGNFHLDNATASGDMFLNYHNNNNVRIGNSATATQASGPILTIFSNRATPFVIYNNFNESSTIQAGFNCGMQHSLLTNSRIMHTGFYKNNSTTPTNTMGLCSDNGAVKPLWLNCYQHSTTDWPTGGKFSPQGSDCIMRSCFIGVRANAGLFSLTNDPLITLGRNVYDYGFKIGGWNGGSADARYAMIQNSGNLHIDGATAGDTYMNYYASGSGRDCRIYNLEDMSDRRIKNDFEEIVNNDTRWCRHDQLKTPRFYYPEAPTNGSCDRNL